MQPIWMSGLETAAALGLAAGGYAYASLWPASRLFGRALIAPPHPNELAMTFDDGPNPLWTPRLLEVLARHRVQGCFFLVGQAAAAQPELVREIAAAGHLVGTHTWSHARLSMLGDRAVRDELTHGREALESILGAPIRLFRPPFGARRPFVLREARRMGLEPVLWNAMTSDWSEPRVERIVARLSAKVERLTGHGSAVNLVLHDGNHLSLDVNRAPSVAAAEELLSRLDGRMRFVRLDAWLPA